MKNIAITTTLSALVLAASLNTSVKADENLWMYTKGTDTRPKDSWEVKLSSISHLGKGVGDYAFHDIRPEVEYGITDKLTVYGEFMIFHHDYSGVPLNEDGESPIDPVGAEGDYKNT